MKELRMKELRESLKRAPRGHPTLKVPRYSLAAHFLGLHSHLSLLYSVPVSGFSFLLKKQHSLLLLYMTNIVNVVMCAHLLDHLCPPSKLLKDSL